MRRSWPLLVPALVLSALAGSCSSVAPVRFEGVEGGAVPAWPAPPGPARVRWAGAYTARADGYVRPHGVAVSSAGGLCVADPPARVVWRHDPDGRVHRVGDGVLRMPVDCAFLPDGGLMVADSMLARVVVFDGRGRIVAKSAEEVFERPVALAVDGPRQRVLVADAMAHRLVAVTWSAAPMQSYGRRGTAPGEFNFPTALAVGSDGTIVVVDSMNFRIQVLGPDGSPITTFGRAGDGPGTFSRPRGVAVDSEGHVWVADALFDNVQIFDRQGRLLLAVGGQGRDRGEFWMPAGVAATGDGRVFVADAFNRRVQVFALQGAGAESS